MPEMYLPNYKSNDPISKSIANIQVTALMLFHDDPVMQNHYVISEIAEHFELATEFPGHHGLKKVTTYDLAEKYLEPFGGLKGLNNAPSKKEMKPRIDKCFRNGDMVGFILFWLWFYGRLPLKTKREAISIRKLKWLAKKELSRIDNPLEERMISTVWKKTKPVAHLWAAYKDLTINDKSREEEVEEEEVEEDGWLLSVHSPGRLAESLKCAERYRDFGVNYIPHGQKKTILSGVDSWVFPEYPASPESRDANLTIPSSDIADNFIELYKKTFKNYKAPKS